MHTRHSSPFPTSFRLNVLLPFFLQIALDYTHIWCFFFSHAFNWHTNWLFSCIYRSTSRYADLEKPKKKKTLSATTSLVSIPNTIKLSMLNSGLLSFGEFYRSIISIELLFVRSFLSLGYFPFIMVVFWHRWHLLINSYTDAISWWSWWANELELELIVNDLLRLLLSTIFFLRCLDSTNYRKHFDETWLPPFRFAWQSSSTMTIHHFFYRRDVIEKFNRFSISHWLT